MPSIPTSAQEEQLASSCARSSGNSSLPSSKIWERPSNISEVVHWRDNKVWAESERSRAISDCETNRDVPSPNAFHRCSGSCYRNILTWTILSLIIDLMSGPCSTCTEDWSSVRILLGSFWHLGNWFRSNSVIPNWSQRRESNCWEAQTQKNGTGQDPFKPS